jgi:hypothetical protein
MTSPNRKSSPILISIFWFLPFFPGKQVLAFLLLENFELFPKSGLAHSARWLHLRGGRSRHLQQKIFMNLLKRVSFLGRSLTTIAWSPLLYIGAID